MNQRIRKAILQTCLILNCCKTIVCHFMIFHQRAPYLQRGLAFQILQLLSMLFSSSSSRWGMLCLLSKRSFAKSWNIVRRPIDIESHLTPFHLSFFNCLSLVEECRAKTTCRTVGRQDGIASNKCGGPPQLQQACLWAAAPYQKKNTLRTILAYVFNIQRTIPNDDSLVCMSVFSAACNLDSGKSSNICHNLPVLLLLSKHWSLAVAVLLPHLRKNSAPIHREKKTWKNIQYWSQKNSNAAALLTWSCSDQW